MTHPHDETESDVVVVLWLLDGLVMSLGSSLSDTTLQTTAPRLLRRQTFSIRTVERRLLRRPSSRTSRQRCPSLQDLGWPCINRPTCRGTNLGSQILRRLLPQRWRPQPFSPCCQLSRHCLTRRPFRRSPPGLVLQPTVVRTSHATSRVHPLRLAWMTRGFRRMNGRGMTSN